MSGKRSANSLDCPSFKENCSIGTPNSKSKSVLAPSGSVCFRTVIVPAFSFVHVHVTVSPATRVIFTAVSPGSKPDVGPFTKRKLANRPITNVEPEPPVRTQPMRSRSQPARVVSFTVYVPGSRSPLSKGVVPSAREKSGSEPSQDALKPNVCGSPGGNVTLSAWISASFSFVHVHVTVSPATRVIFTAVSPGSKPDVGPFTKRKLANRPITNVEPEPPVRTQPMRSRSQPARVVSFTVYVPGSRSPLSKGVVPSAREKSGSEPSQDALKPNVCGSPGGNVTLSAWI